MEICHGCTNSNTIKPREESHHHAMLTIATYFQSAMIVSSLVSLIFIIQRHAA
ncbi:hypothetical protein BDZ85DRAFT_37550 [Elsinoe ampelina]|uniref:Uncharacterized protein n=1 Tax=Elsinoe ampelina TaxID=302913 RepID=A0A6A6G352_9PEZI|nr:hypothetical protein BDZ85DRAFT_37550 [Elsinoe ampelina]